MKVIDKFTTRDGRWDVDPSKPYSISTGALQKYGAWDIPGKGGANHIFVNAPFGALVEFRTNDGLLHKSTLIDSLGWINFPMFASSGYNVDRGEQGPWQVFVNGVRVATGIGLPNGWHVSTFLIVGEGVSRPPEPGDADKLRQVADLARRILELVSVLIVAMILTACEPVVLPAWYAPVQDHSLECIGGIQGECSLSPLRTRGSM